MLFVVLCCLYYQVATVTVNYAPENAIKGKYIMVFANVTQNEISNYLMRLKMENVNITRTFSFGDFNAVSVFLDDEQLNKRLVEDSILSYIDEDRVISIGNTHHVDQVICSEQEDAEWNLVRVSEEVYDKSMNKYRYVFEPPVYETTTYVIDTGIRTTHEEFKGEEGPRAFWGTNTVDSRNEDCNGHGTHVAGTIGGNLYGLVKNAHLIAVKVLACDGSGSIESVVSGIEWVTKDAAQNQNKKYTANMSLGGGASTALDAAVQASIVQGITYVVAAGNSNNNACLYSPARVANAISVGATEISAVGQPEKQIDLRSYYSNFGTCVDVFAPGTLIKAAWSTSDTATATISGTSMASPHVCGVAHQLLSFGIATNPASAKEIIRGLATKNIVELNCGSNTVCQQSPNYFLYFPC